jgi:TRAP-type C4-dicarboxylate transport system substrate-binding protein
VLELEKLLEKGTVFMSFYKISFRITFFFVAVFLSVSSIGYCRLDGTKPGENKVLKLTYAEVNPATSYAGYIARLFKQRVEELSLGTILIDVKYGGELGNDNEVLTNMFQYNSPDIIRTSVSYLQDFGANKAAMLSTPYVFENREHYWKFINSNLYKEFLDEISISGSRFKGLAFIEEGFRHFFSRKPINSLSELAGLKIRSAYGNYFEDLIKVFGAYSVKVPFTEFNTAIERGIIDGGEQPIVNYLSNEFYKRAPYLILDAHVLALSEIVISENIWDQMTEQQKNVVLRAADYIQRVNKVTVKGFEEKALNQLKDYGVVVTEITDMSPWKEKCSELVFKITKAYAELYNKIQEVK